MLEKSLRLKNLGYIAVIIIIKLFIMELREVKTLTDIKQGDTLILTGHTLKNEPVKAQIVKVTPIDGTEIIIDKKQNRFFNLGMYLEGKSWVKNVSVVSETECQTL